MTESLELTPTDEAIQRDVRKRRKASRWAIMFSALAVAAGGKIVKAEMDTGWNRSLYKDPAMEITAVIGGFGLGGALGSVLNRRDANSLLNYRLEMRRRQEEIQDEE